MQLDKNINRIQNTQSDCLYKALFEFDQGLYWRNWANASNYAGVMDGIQPLVLKYRHASLAHCAETG
jgi:hypothetical protein